MKANHTSEKKSKKNEQREMAVRGYFSYACNYKERPMGHFFKSTREAYYFCKENLTNRQVRNTIKKLGLNRKIKASLQEDKLISLNKKINFILENEMVVAKCDHYKGNSSVMVCSESYAKTHPHVIRDDRGVIGTRRATSLDYKNLFVYIH